MIRVYKIYSIVLIICQINKYCWLKMCKRSIAMIYYSSETVCNSEERKKVEVVITVIIDYLSAVFVCCRKVFF